MEKPIKKLRLEDIQVDSFVIDNATIVFTVKGGATGGVDGCYGPDQTAPDCNSRAKSYCQYSCGCFQDS